MKKIILGVLKIVVMTICFILANRMFEMKFNAEESWKEISFGMAGLVLLIPYYKLLFK